MERLIGKLTVEWKAPFYAHREHKIELCEQDTRVSLLADATEWAKGTGPHHERRIMWLNGRAGVGKSTIAITLATWFHAQNMLGSSFMFSKRNGVTDGSKVFTTIAHQFVQHLPGFKKHLAAAIKAKEDSIHADIRQQFEDLLATPLSPLQLPPATVVILDALDECSTPETLTEMLTVLVEITSRFPFLRLLITSRPEPLIQQVLHRVAEHVYEVDLNKIPASEDIATYLQGRLSSEYRLITDGYSEHQTWPAEADLAWLVSLANNLFVFAATAVRFISDKRAAEPQRRLELILRGPRISKERPLSTLDIMYQEILQNALPEGDIDDNVHARFRDVVGAIIYSVEIHSVNSLAILLKSMHSASSIRNSLKYLHAVLVVPKEDNQVGLQVYHQSFADFITDPTRCTRPDAQILPFHSARLCIWHIETVLVQSNYLLFEQSVNKLAAQLRVLTNITIALYPLAVNKVRMIPTIHVCNASDIIWDLTGLATCTTYTL